MHLEASETAPLIKNGRKASCCTGQGKVCLILLFALSTVLITTLTVLIIFLTTKSTSVATQEKPTDEISETCLQSCQQALRTPAAADPKINLLQLPFNAMKDAGSGAELVPKTKPNIIILLADDLGYGDLASYGNPSQEWGPIDDLAKEGLRFNQAYAADTMCSPSRAGLLTGRLPIRSGIVGGAAGRVFGSRDTGGLPAAELTIPELLKREGYQTGMVGKWHLGINNYNSTDGTHLPANHGFDYVGVNLPLSNFWECDESGIFRKEGPMESRCFLYNNTKLIQQPIDHTNLTQMLLDGFAQFINQRDKSRPFFFYFSFPQVHTDLYASAEFRGKSSRGMFGDSLNELSWAVGKVMTQLKAANLDKNTFTTFLSDHGPHIELCLAGGVTGGLKGGKSNSFEGGFRIPFITHWPGVIPSGAESPAIVSMFDLLPTFVALANGTLPSDRVFDGNDMRNSLLGRVIPNRDEQRESPRPLFFYCNRILMAVRYGAYKVHYYTVPVFETGTNASLLQCPGGWPVQNMFVMGNCPDDQVTPHHPPLVYDLEKDPQEQFPIDVRPMSAVGETVVEVGKIVAEHKKTLVKGVEQIGNFSAAVVPCCNPPSCTCHN